MLYGNASYEDIKNNRNSIEISKFEYLMKSFKKGLDFSKIYFGRFFLELNRIKRKNVNKRKIMDIKEKWGIFYLKMTQTK